MNAARRMGLAMVALGALVGIAGCSDAPTPLPPTRPPVALGPVELTGVGNVAQDGASANDLVLRFTESNPSAIGSGSGSLQITLTDHAGLPDTIGFTGAPLIQAPGSLGAAATLSSPNVLTVSIVDSDTYNIEQITITGLGIRAAPTAAVGSINAVISGCAGSLAGCAATNVLTSPGSVMAAP